MNFSLGGNTFHIHYKMYLTHWGQVTHICVSNSTIIISDNGLSPGRHQAITWTNDGILIIGPLGTNFSESLIGIQTFSFKKIHLKMSSAKWRPLWLGLNVLKHVFKITATTPSIRQQAITWSNADKVPWLYNISSLQCIELIADTNILLLPGL